VSKITLKPKAKADIAGIWDYSVENWGEEKAETYLRDLWSRIHQVADKPDLALKADIVRAGYRKILSGNHVIYFKEIEGGIDIVRVLHQRMDFKGKV